jgi:acetoin utilization protein AcuB
MTPKPYTIDRRATFTQARQVMRDHAIRHLPVVERGELCGIVSSRDLIMFEAGGADPNVAQVNVAMLESPFIVTGVSVRPNFHDTRTAT